jgi:hypothetical protein
MLVITCAWEQPVAPASAAMLLGTPPRLALPCILGHMAQQAARHILRLRPVPCMLLTLSLLMAPQLCCRCRCTLASRPAGGIGNQCGNIVDGERGTAQAEDAGGLFTLQAADRQATGLRGSALQRCCSKLLCICSRLLAGGHLMACAGVLRRCGAEPG